MNNTRITQIFIVHHSNSASFLPNNSKKLLKFFISFLTFSVLTFSTFLTLNTPNQKHPKRKKVLIVCFLFSKLFVSQTHFYFLVCIPKF